MTSELPFLDRKLDQQPAQKNAWFDSHCQRCPRLAGFLDEVREKHPDYFAAPVPQFGPSDAKLLIVGLAPGMHGANRTGRPFTGDHAGILLYQTLFNKGLSNQADALAIDDGLQLINCRISNAVKCLPPGNKPTTKEVITCNTFLKNELDSLADSTVIIALGSIAHNVVLRAEGLTLSRYKFAHNQTHDLSRSRTLVDSYHCSRYNTQTKRLTPAMFEAVFDTAIALF